MVLCRGLRYVHHANDVNSVLLLAVHSLTVLIYFRNQIIQSLLQEAFQLALLYFCRSIHQKQKSKQKISNISLEVKFVLLFLEFTTLLPLRVYPQLHNLFWKSLILGTVSVNQICIKRCIEMRSVAFQWYAHPHVLKLL